MEALQTTYVVIVAAGSGTRFGASLPKQFHPLGKSGHPVLMHTISAFINTGIPSENVLLVLSEDGVEIWKELCIRYGFDSPKVIRGGDTRFESVRNALAQLKCDNESVVLIHDGARPLVSCELINRIACRTREKSSAIPVVPVRDSLRFRADNDETVSVDRKNYFAVQTPQGFKAEMIIKAYELPYNDSFTDDASVAEFAGNSMNVVPGEPDNFKITTPRDIVLANALLASQE